MREFQQIPTPALKVWQMRSRLLSALGIVVLALAGCGGQSDPKAVPSSAAPQQPEAADIEIVGDAEAPVNKLAMAAIVNLQEFWGEQFPKLYGDDYAPVEGGLYALTPDSEQGPECASSFADVSGNAFYCKIDDSVSWDADGLLPELQQKFGDFVIPVVLAHEWGHAMQQRSGFFDQNEYTVSAELQADCFAGAWSSHARETGVFEVSEAELDTALAGILDLRDTPGTSAQDGSAHGSGFDRVSAFQDGYDNGVERCKDYQDGEPMVLELPFTTEEDAANEGNAPYDSIVNGVPYDIEDFWTQLYPELTGGQVWQPVAGLAPFDPADPPLCGGTPADGYALFYCVPDDYVAWDNVNVMPQIYDEGGDYAVATLLATQYGLAALTRVGDQSDEKTSTLRADCLAGGYTASVILYNREATSSYHISPGDLDEGIKALLVFRSEGDAQRQGAGFARVRAFRQGVLEGAESCLDYQP
ncbi:neutral zinc metallopeptidase [soil metagenome]